MLDCELTRVEMYPVVQAKGVTHLVNLVPRLDDVSGQSMTLCFFLLVLVDADDPSPVQVVEGFRNSLDSVKPLVFSLDCT